MNREYGREPFLTLGSRFLARNTNAWEGCAGYAGVAGMTSVLGLASCQSARSAIRSRSILTSFVRSKTVISRLVAVLRLLRRLALRRRIGGEFDTSSFVAGTRSRPPWVRLDSAVGGCSVGADRRRGRLPCALGVPDVHQAAAVVADVADRTGTRGGRRPESPVAPRCPARDADWPGRRRQDAARPPGCRPAWPMPSPTAPSSFRLASITDPDLVTSAIAQTVGVREAGDSPLLDRMEAAFRGGARLLVLDNFEQVALPPRWSPGSSGPAPR